MFADASDLFLDRLAGVTDPEKKRKIIGNTFIDVFEAEAHKLGQVDFLGQGTLYQSGQFISRGRSRVHGPAGGGIQCPF